MLPKLISSNPAEPGRPLAETFNTEERSKRRKVSQNLVGYFRFRIPSISSVSSTPPCWTAFLNRPTRHDTPEYTKKSVPRRHALGTKADLGSFLGLEHLEGTMQLVVIFRLHLLRLVRSIAVLVLG